MTEYFKNLDVSRYNLRDLRFPEEVINELYAVFKDGNVLTNDEMRSVIEQCFDTFISSDQIKSTIYNLLSDDKFGNSNPPETIAGWLFLDEKNDVVERLTDEFVEKYGRRSTTLIQIYDFLRNHPYYSDKVIPNLNFEWINETKVGVIKNIKSFKLKLLIKQNIEKLPDAEDRQILLSYIETIENYDSLMQTYEILKENDIEQVQKRIKEIQIAIEYRIMKSLGNCECSEHSRWLIEYINKFLDSYLPKTEEYPLVETENDIDLSFFNEKNMRTIKMTALNIIMFADKLQNLGIINSQIDVVLEENVDNLLDKVKEMIDNGEDASDLLQSILSYVKVLIEKMIELGYKMDEISVDGLENLDVKGLYERLREISSIIGNVIDNAKINELRSLDFSLPGMPKINAFIKEYELSELPDFSSHGFFSNGNPPSRKH